MNNRSQPLISFWQVLTLTILFLTAGVWLASALSVLIMNGAHTWGGVAGAYLVEEGAPKIMRRCLLVFSIAFLGVFLWRAGWQGWRDCGLTTTDPDWSWRTWHTGLLNGLALGILSMGLIGTLITLARIHRLYFPPELAVQDWIKAVFFLLLSALVVGFFEEILVRGILFRILARIWRAWPAAVLSSLVFAIAHFIEPSQEAFNGTSFLPVTQAVFVSTLTMFGKDPDLAIKFINLSLLGIVLCAFVIRTKTVWLSVGAHVGWVWMIKMHGLITMYYPLEKMVAELQARQTPLHSIMASLLPWLGQRNDFMDSIMATLMLTGLLAWTVMRPATCGRLLPRQQWPAWHVLPGEETRLLKWLDSRGQAGAINGERVLKAYAGCRVTAQAGMVLKEYRPVAGRRGWRFGFRPSRTRRAFIMGRRLLACGIPTPTPIAWATQRRYGLRRADCLLTTELKQTEPLTDWLRHQATATAMRTGVMQAYGQLAAKFHRNGFFNRDLKHENVLCAKADPSQLWVVDLDGVHWRGWITRRRAARDLRRVGLSLATAGWSAQTDLAAFFAAYNAVVPARLRRKTFPA